MKTPLLIIILAVAALVAAQAEDVDGGISHNAAQLLELGAKAGACTTLVDLAAFAAKETRSDNTAAAAFVSRFLRQFLDKHHNTPTTWEMCASIEDEYAAAEKRLGIK